MAERYLATVTIIGCCLPVDKYLAGVSIDEWVALFQAKRAFFTSMTTDGLYTLQLFSEVFYDAIMRLRPDVSTKTKRLFKEPPYANKVLRNLLFVSESSTRTLL